MVCPSSYMTALLVKSPLAGPLVITRSRDPTKILAYFSPMIHTINLASNLAFAIALNVLVLLFQVYHYLQLAESLSMFLEEDISFKLVYVASKLGPCKFAVY